MTRLRPAAPVSEEKREGRKGLVVDVASWWKALDFLGERATAARTRLVRIADERRQLEAERDRLRADVAKLNQGGFSDRLVQVIAVLEPAAAGPVELELEYFVPGARWKPAYNLYFSSARGQLTMETTAVVEQATGEDWPQAALSFSTAMPGRGIDLPELLTWTLGERSEFVPTLRPRQPPRVEPLLPMPAAGSAASEAHAIAAEIVRERLARAAGAARPARGDGIGDPPSAAASQEETARSGTRTRSRSWWPNALSDRAPSAPAARTRAQYDFEIRRRRAAPPAKAAPAIGAPAPAPAAGRRDRADRESRERKPAASAGRTSSSCPGADRARARERQRRAHLVRAAVARRRDRRAPPADLHRSVPAGGQRRRPRLRLPRAHRRDGRELPARRCASRSASQTFRTAAFYEATPALAATAFLRARVRNDGKRPLLRGPATIFGDGEFVGLGEIKTTGPSGDIEFPLGADQDIRLVRQIVPSSKTTGLIIKSRGDRLRRPDPGRQLQEAAGHRRGDRPGADQPQRRHRGQAARRPTRRRSGSPDIDGVIRWRVPIPAGETRTLKLRYQITRPKDWKLYQR